MKRTQGFGIVFDEAIALWVVTGRAFINVGKRRPSAGVQIECVNLDEATDCLERLFHAYSNTQPFSNTSEVIIEDEDFLKELQGMGDEQRTPKMPRRQPSKSR